jgi:uncharacterized protein with PQ loop repeat
MQKEKTKKITREEFAQKIHWSFIIWLVGMVNAVAMIPQLLQIWSTKSTAGLALEMFITYCTIQIALTLEGFFNRNRMLMVCFGLSAIVSMVIIASVLYLRHYQ